MDCSNIKCCEHNKSNVVGICVDYNCLLENKFVCLECIFTLHSQHKLIKLKELEEFIDYSKEEKKKRIENFYLKEKLEFLELSIIKEFENVKTVVLEYLNLKLNEIISKVKTKLTEKYENEKREKEELEVILNNKFEDKDKIQELQKIIFSKFISLNNDNNTLQIKNKNIDTDESVLCYLERIDENIRRQMLKFKTQIKKYIKSEFFKTDTYLNNNTISFQWCEKIYGNYSFLYSLNNDKSIGIKALNDATITILRSKHKLIQSQNYFVEFQIENKKFGDFDIGIGSDNIGSECWLRCLGTIGLTDIGLFENGKLIRKDLKIEDKDIIGFEIFLKDVDNKQIKIYKNGHKKHELKLSMDNIYLMTAIRKIGNSIIVRDFNIIE